MSAIPLRPRNVLDVSLKRTPPDANFKRAAINKIWSTHLNLADFSEEAYSAYFHHTYQGLCNAACTGSSQIPNFTHEQVLTIVTKLRAGSHSQDQIVAELQRLRENTPPAEAERAVNLAASLLLPLNFRGAGGVRRGETVNWATTESLEHVINPKIAVLLTATESALKSSLSGCKNCDLSLRFPTSFNARQLKYVAGFEIVWTSNLLDHLLVLDADEKVKVYIYHQVKLLRHHRESLCPLIPQDLISETFDTLALLLPRTKRNVRKWYQKQQKSHTLDPEALRCGHLRLEDREVGHFRYWGDRLLRLKRAYDGHEPKGPLQWWRDDRKSVQWWTFWIAALVLVLTIVFGFIQSVTSILQVAKS